MRPRKLESIARGAQMRLFVRWEPTASVSALMVALRLSLPLLLMHLNSRVLEQRQPSRVKLMPLRSQVTRQAPKPLKKQLRRVPLGSPALVVLQLWYLPSV